MNRKKKITISFMAVLLVMALAATIVSFSLAGNNGDDDQTTTDELLAAADANSKSLKTIIDYIIENSYSTTATDTMYHIVEIGSGPASTKQSTLDAFTSAANPAALSAFADCVLNGNHSSNLAKDGDVYKLMEAGKIDYQYFDGTDASTADAACQAVASADFMYVSNSATEAFADGNDLQDKLYDAIKIYVNQQYRPLVIDSPESGIETPSVKYTSFADLVSNYYDTVGGKYYTYGWENTTPASTFFSTTMGETQYIGINSTTAQANWGTIYTGSDLGTSHRVAKILTISSDTATNYAVQDMVLDSCSLVDDTSDLWIDGSTQVTTANNIYSIAGSPFLAGAYSQRYMNPRPEYVQVDKTTLTDSDGDGVFTIDTSINFSQYDLILVEKDCASVGGTGRIDMDSFNALLSAMYADNHIIYDQSIVGNNSGSGASGGSTVVSTGEKYQELFNLVATVNTKGNGYVAKDSNIMVTTTKEFNAIISSTATADSCKVIADLINASAWRSIGGKSKSNTYMVLEIQPCYPINEQIANKKNNYYTNPSDVANNKTAEQLGYTTKQVTLADGTTTTKIDDSQVTTSSKEFYNWELSEAMVADSLGIDASQVVIKHMSTEEFACNKGEILGSYDMIYIGGNTTALKPAEDRAGVLALNSDGSTATLGTKAANMAQTPTYFMYSHNGDTVPVDFTGYAKLDSNPQLKTGSAVQTIGNNGKMSFAQLTGNDLSYTNYTDLVDYIDAGMPIVFSDTVTLAYKIARDDGYLQNTIDPDSNMYKLLNYCYDKTYDENDTRLADNNQIQFDLNVDYTELSDSDSGRLGTTSMVTVLNDTQADILSTAYNDGKKRPKLAIKESPVQYNLSDPNTKLSAGPINFAYDVTGTTSYVAKLYLDDDANSVFADNEVFAQSTTGTLTCDLSAFKGGPVYWKLEITSVDGQKVNTTGTFYIKPKSDEKTDIHVLQLIPDNLSIGAQSTMSLYFCTECQRSYSQVEYNPLSVGNRLSDGALYASADGSTSFGDQYTDKYGFEEQTGRHIYMGKHQHTFGIVNYDDSLANTSSANGTGRDDWDYNLADELKDLYDFDIDIMTTSEYESLANELFDYFDSSFIFDADGKLTVDGSGDPRTTDTSTLGAGETAKPFYTDAAKTKIDPVVAKAVIEAEEKRATEAKTKLDAFTDDGSDGGTKGDLQLAQDELNAVLTNMISNCGDAYDKSELQRILDYGTDDIIGNECYNDLFNIQGITTYKGSSKWLNYCTGEYRAEHELVLPAGYTNLTFSAYRNANNIGTRFSGYEYYYQVYALACDQKLYLSDEYKDALRKAKYLDNWLLGTYDSIIVGPAENFNNDDLYGEKNYDTAAWYEMPGLYDLAEYVENDGSIILFHETLSRYTNTGTTNLTKALLGDFGNNPSHMTLDTDLVGDGKSIEVKNKVNPSSGGVSALKLKFTTSNGAVFSGDINNFNVNSETLNYSVTNNNGTYMGGTLSSTGSLSSVGDITVNVSVDVPNGDSIASASLDYSYTIYYPAASYNIKATATIAADGKSITFKLPNYYTQNVTASDIHYLPYKTSDGYDSNRYYLTNLSYRDNNDSAKYATWSADMNTATESWRNFNSYYYVPMLFSSTQFFDEGGSGKGNASPYKYGEFSWALAAKWANSANGLSSGNAGSSVATRNNDGIVTTYPFTLSDELHISGTHPSAYGLDIESDDMTVWYSLAGGTNSTTDAKKHSSIYAATPNDGADNYFIYSYGNVYFCGTGHTTVTGMHRKNNDERKLYINVICSAIRNSVRQPSIDVYDYGTTKNDDIKKGDNGYIYEIDDETEYPIFTFRSIVDEEAKISTVELYYKLDADNPTNEFIEGKDVRIVSWDGDAVKSGQLVNVSSTIGALKLLDSYFEPYGGNYTYIVIKVTDDKGNVTYQRIQIIRKAHLFDLT